MIRTFWGFLGASRTCANFRDPTAEFRLNPTKNPKKSNYMYMIVKHSHLTLMLLSVSFLIIRVLASTQNAQWLQQKWAKIAPHIIDTLLLISAVILMTLISQYPIADNWISAKVVALIAYIGLGTMAFKGNKSALTKIFFLLLALTVIGYMIAVAVTKQAFPWAI